MKTNMLPNEVLVKEGAANLQRGIESVGGRLYLTNDRLIFESHGFNIQRGTVIIPLANVVQTKLTRTKFLNLIPTFSNSLAIVTKVGDQYKFVLFNRSEWKNIIDTQIAI